MELSTLKIERLIFHQITRRSMEDENFQSKHNENFIELDYAAERIFLERINGALKNSSTRIEMDIKDHGEFSAFHLISQMFASEPQKFIDYSKHLTDRLASAQTSQ